MSQNRLGIAILVLLVLGGLVYYQQSAREAQDQTAPTASVKLPKLARDSIDELELTAEGKPKVRLVKQGAEWRLAEPVDAKADQDAVGTVLDKLAELEVTGVAATKAKNHERLEVDDKKGTHVIAKSAGKPLIDALIGTYQSGNTMLRLQGQDAVASVKGSIRFAFGKEVREWRDRAITKVDPKAVQEIGFENEHGRFRFTRDGEGWKQVLGKGEKRIDALDNSKVSGLVSTAASLSATDFADQGVTSEQAGLAAGAARVTLSVSGDAGVESVAYSIGGEIEKNYYLQRDGIDTIFIVSSWIAGRLKPAADGFVKKENEAAAEPAAAPMAMPQGMQGLPPNIEAMLRQQAAQQQQQQ